MSDYEYIKATVTLPMPGDDSETVDYPCQFDFDYHAGDEEEIEIKRLWLEITDFVWVGPQHIFDFKTVGDKVPHFESVEDQLEAAAKAHLKHLKDANDMQAQIVAHQQDNNL